MADNLVYACGECGSRFAQEGALSAHLEGVHGNAEAGAPRLAKVGSSDAPDTAGTPSSSSRSAPGVRVTLGTPGLVDAGQAPGARIVSVKLSVLHHGDMVCRLARAVLILGHFGSVLMVSAGFSDDMPGLIAVGLAGALQVSIMWAVLRAIGLYLKLAAEPT